MRIMALSDIHVDYRENMAYIEALSTVDYREDCLLLAGDATHDLERLERAFEVLQRKFKYVFFVPGNHELWVMKGEQGDSWQKFNRILALCDRCGVYTRPIRVGRDRRAWIVPLFSWYITPDDGHDDTLYLPKNGGDAGMTVWSDSYFVKWPEFERGMLPAQYFLKLNEPHVERTYEEPVISFSHFLPRHEVLFGMDFDYHGRLEALRKERVEPVINPDGGFNFSRVAGTSALERQVRRLGSVVHVHGHQHRNRFRVIDGVLYASHCLGYKHERMRDLIRGIDDGPIVVWSDAADWSPESMEQY